MPSPTVRPRATTSRTSTARTSSATTSTSGPKTRAAARKPSIDAAGRKDAQRLIVLVGALMGLGLIMVLSASSVISITNYGSPWSLFERQSMWTVLGIVAFMVSSRVTLARWRRLAPMMLGVSIFLLLLVLLHGVGTVSGGASRWIGVGPFTIQPSEFAKLAFAIFAADLVARRQGARDELHEIVKPVVLVLGGVGILILRQPDMGTAVILGCITLTILYVGGIRGRLLTTALCIAGAGGLFLSIFAPYRRARLMSFTNPWAHASTSGYQIVQSLVALGSGHLTGTGIGSSVAAWGLLPNAQTDFIFAIIGNELGLIGACLVLAAFCAFGYLGIRIAARTQDPFACLLAAAITCWIVCQALINIGGVLSVLPDTGIPLPFLSFGGSSLVVILIAAGVLVNIARNPTLSVAAAVAPVRNRVRADAMRIARAR